MSPAVISVRRARRGRLLCARLAIEGAINDLVRRRCWRCALKSLRLACRLLWQAIREGR